MLHLNTLFARPALTLATAAAALAVAAPAVAAPAANLPTVEVRLNTAELSGGAAATTIHRRIAAAARQVCAPQGATLREQMDARQCYAKAVRSGEGQLVALRELAKSRQQTLATAAR
ncbi:UrcA family protein [Novosphingobium piscinae]|uniref:UrcA family protein n=1 Tax=Novosphingobium piscinae TaxID=1507448 RepID=A0A7X1FV89_9SPHN|nr:UrcA family protein [Novosphingobium piscinae]MBC2667611.1 UrcA family protein [Novosphingobium piscinae]